MLQKKQTLGDQDSVIAQDAIDPSAWRDYVQRRAGGGLYHRYEWDEVFAVYGREVLRLAVVRDERICGVLPLVCQKSLIFGRRLVSLPWFDAAGVLADDTDAEEALLSEAGRHAARLDVTEIHLRQSAPLASLASPRTDKVLMRLPLACDAETLWKRLSPKVRNQVRKAEKSGLSYQSGGHSLLEEFYQVYCTNMRDLGSPPHGREFMERVVAAFGEDVRVHAIRIGGRMIGGGVTMANGEVLEIPWASSWRRYNALCVNHILYWNILKGACEQGFAAFHFGRSTVDSGTYKFKRQWGAEPCPLYWYTIDAAGTETSDEHRPEESFSLFRRIWQSLPVGLVRHIGPRIIRNVP